MTDKRDPFELLPRFVDPEPDTVIMDATIAQSREAFLNRQNKAPDRSGPALWFRRSAHWLAPASIGALAAVVAIAMAMTLAGSFLPTLRAVRLDPIRALRNE